MGKLPSKVTCCLISTSKTVARSPLFKANGQNPGSRSLSTSSSIVASTRPMLAQTQRYTSLFSALSRRQYSQIQRSAQYGQPTWMTHPHLMKQGESTLHKGVQTGCAHGTDLVMIFREENNLTRTCSFFTALLVTPGISSAEYEIRRTLLMECLPKDSIVISTSHRTRFMTNNILYGKQPSDLIPYWLAAAGLMISLSSQHLSCLATPSTNTRTFLTCVVSSYGQLAWITGTTNGPILDLFLTHLDDFVLYYLGFNEPDSALVLGKHEPHAPCFH